MKSLLTELTQILSGKRSGKIALPEFIPSKFEGLYSPKTLRLLTSWEFCEFGRLEAEKALNWPRDKFMPMSELPPSVIPPSTFWFELKDSPFREEGGELEGDQQAIWVKKISSQIITRDGLSGQAAEAYFIERDAGGYLRCLTLGERSQGVFSFRLSRLSGALFALNEMPSVVSHTKRDNVLIPTICRPDEPNSAYALFSHIYLKREFSDEISKNTSGHVNINGVRFHFVRGHWMKLPNKEKRVWRKFHWRGNADLGTVRKVVHL